MNEGTLSLKALCLILRDQAIGKEARVDGDVREAHEYVLGQHRGEVLVESAILDSDVLSVHNVNRVLSGRV
jgi:hypothetical protein